MARYSKELSSIYARKYTASEHLNENQVVSIDVTHVIKIKDATNACKFILDVRKESFSVKCASVAKQL